MARLIDADALKQKFVAWLPKADDEFMSGDIHPIENIAVSAIMEIEEAPTIDTVKHGKWNAVPNRILVGRRVATQGTAWECSACNNSSKQYLPTMKFCPNCGARMDGE